VYGDCLRRLDPLTHQGDNAAECNADETANHTPDDNWQIHSVSQWMGPNQTHLHPECHADVAEDVNAHRPWDRPVHSGKPEESAHDCPDYDPAESKFGSVVQTR
jgi:hypothetical protein